MITGTGQLAQDLGTQDQALELAQGLGRAVHRALAELARQNPERRLAARARRYRHLGQ